MAIRMLSNPRPIWFVWVAMALAIAMLGILKLTSGMEFVQRTVEGQTTTFTEPPWMAALICAPMLKPIIDALKSRNVSLGDPDDGLAIPPELAASLR